MLFRTGFVTRRIARATRTPMVTPAEIVMMLVGRPGQLKPRSHWKKAIWARRTDHGEQADVKDVARVVLEADALLQLLGRP